MHYQPPGGWHGSHSRKLFGKEPEQQMREDLRRFKQIRNRRSAHHARPARGPRSYDRPTDRTEDRFMRANCWNGENDLRVEYVPDPSIINPRDAIIRITSTAICGSDLHLYNGYVPTMMEGDILGHEFMGDVVEVGPGVTNLKRRRPCGESVSDRLRRLLLLSGPRVLAMRELQPERVDGGEDVGTFTGGTVRLLAHARRIRRRASGVRAYSVRGRGAHQSSGPSHGRAGAVPVGHFSHRLHGRRELQYPAGRYRRGVGLRTGGLFAIASAFILGAGRVIAIDRVPGAAAQWPARTWIRRDAQLRGGRCAGSAARVDRRPRAGRLYRCGRHGSARPWVLRDTTTR